MQYGRVITYVSRQLKDHELNYPTHELELAADACIENVVTLFVLSNIWGVYRSQEREIHLLLEKT